MARTHYDIGLRMTKMQLVMGWLYLPIYLVLAAEAIVFLGNLFGLNLSQYTVNLLYFSLNIVFVLLVYHRFLGKSFAAFFKRFWPFIQTLILGFAMYYITNILLVGVFSVITDDTTVVNNETVAALVSENTTVMLLFSVIAAPIVEETLVRGVVFGTFHRVNRYLAYAASILLFSVMHVWQYAGDLTFMGLLFNGLVYVPASIALGWTYEKSGTILCPIMLHMIINAIAFGVTTILF